MKSLTSTAVVALTAGLIAVGGMVPVANAQQQTQPVPGQQEMQPGQMHPHMRGFNLNQRHHRGMQGMQGMNRAGRVGILDMVCSDRAAERLELALVRLSYRIELTPAQQALFDDLRTTALTAQTQFADRCNTAAQPSANTATAPDPIAAMRARLELDKARIDAIEGVLPKFEALFNSLSDAQKGQLSPRANNRGQGFQRRGPGMGMNGGPHRRGPGMMQPQPAERGAPQAPAPAN